MDKTYGIHIEVIATSTLDKEQLTRQLVVALWEGMDESLVIPDSATDELRVIEYMETRVEEVV